ncbi:MAG: hypothetical protein ABI488_18910 [Polyangiaceae bacterium]
MLKNKVAWPLALLVCASLWACGSDDDSTGAAPGGAGEGGASVGGHGGRPSGGSGGADGGKSSGGGDATPSGGTGGQAGSSNGGTSGAAPEAGSGGDFPSVAGMPGMTDGGAGEAGNGGQGSVSSTTLAQDCATVCGGQAALSCHYDMCEATCLGIFDPQLGTMVPDEYTAMIKCQAATLTASNYECSTQANTMVQPSPKAGTSCETLICKFTCDDGMFVDENIIARCGCS